MMGGKGKPSAAVVLDFMGPKKPMEEEPMEESEAPEEDADALIAEIQERLDRLKQCTGGGAY